MKKIYDLSDFGIFPDAGEDCSEKLQKFFEGMEDHADVLFRPGRYFVRYCVTVKNKAALRILGNGATIVSHFDPCGPKQNSNNVLDFYSCSDLVIEGLFVDTDAPIGAAGEVTAINHADGTLDVKIYDEFPVTGYEHFCATNSMDESGSPDYILATYNDRLEQGKFVLPDGTKAKRYEGMKYNLIGKQTVRLRLGHPLPDAERCRLKLGHKINIRYEIYGHTVFSFNFCDRVLMKDVVIFSAASFGVRIAPRSSDFTFDGFVIRVREGSKALMAINADGIHVLGMTGKLTLKNCTMEAMGDDTLNIHGLAACVTELFPEENRLMMVGRLNTLYHEIVVQTWAVPGDVIDVYDPESFLKTGELTVTEQLADGTLRYREPKGILEPGSVLANRNYYAGVHIDGCTLRNTRARGILVQSQNVLVENCRISGMSLAAMLFSPDIRMWWEVGPTKNVEIRNNVIEHCATSHSGYNEGAIVFKASHEGDCTQYPAGVHENIYIHGNTFRNIPNSAVFVCASKNVRVEENEFCGCCCDPIDPTQPYAKYDIVTVNCENVTVCGNHSDRGTETLHYGAE